jgi:hypothetical protein
MGCGAGDTTLVGGGAWLITAAAVCGGATAGTGVADAVRCVRSATGMFGGVPGVRGAAGVGILATMGARTTTVGAICAAGRAAASCGAGPLRACAVVRA